METAIGKGKWWKNIFDVSFKEVANTGVLFRNQKLYALWEAALPYEIDPVSLDTIGSTDLQGIPAPGKSSECQAR